MERRRPHHTQPAACLALPAFLPSCLPAFLDAPTGTATEGGGAARTPRCALLTNLRWDAHTANCQYCQDAHRRFLWLRNGGLAVGATAVVALPTAEERAAALVAAAALAAALQFVIGLFRRYEFSHAEND